MARSRDDVARELRAVGKGRAVAVQLTVLTYNIRSGLNRPELNHAARLEELARVIENENPDIVALQEVDRNTVRSGHTDQTAWLAQRLGLPHHFFGAATPWPGGGEYGVALLSRYELHDAAVRQLYVESGPDVPESATEPRVLLSATIRRNGQEIRLFNTHLGLTQLQRSRQVNEIAATVRAVPTGIPVLLTGDLNAQPADAELAPLLNLLADAHAALPRERRRTYPQGTPLDQGKVIDYILHAPELIKVSDARVIAEMTGASDHNPLVAQFVLARH